ncbi:hypothetical protein GQ457_04G027900 [Hibiscus cannabinus]
MFIGDNLTTSDEIRRPNTSNPTLKSKVVFVRDEDHLLLTRDGLLLGDKCLLLWLGVEVPWQGQQSCWNMERGLMWG